MRKKLFSEGESSSLFSASEIFGVDRSSERPKRDLPPFCPLACTSCCTSCETAHRHLTARWFSRPLSAACRRHCCCFCCCWTTSHSWHCSLRTLFGNPKPGFRSGMPPSQSPSQPLIPGLLSLYLSWLFKARAKCAAAASASAAGKQIHTSSHTLKPHRPTNNPSPIFNLVGLTGHSLQGRLRPDGQTFLDMCYFLFICHVALCRCTEYGQ